MRPPGISPKRWELIQLESKVGLPYSLGGPYDGGEAQGIAARISQLKSELGIWDPLNSGPQSYRGPSVSAGPSVKQQEDRFSKWLDAHFWDLTWGPPGRVIIDPNGQKWPTGLYWHFFRGAPRVRLPSGSGSE